MPDFLCVLTDGTVRGELACAQDVHQALTAKCHLVSVVTVGAELLNDVGSIVHLDEVLVTVHQIVEQLLLGIVGGDGAVNQSIHGLTQTVIDLIDATGVVMLCQSVELLDSVTKDVFILTASLLVDLNVCAAASVLCSRAITLLRS